MPLKAVDHALEVMRIEIATLSANIGQMVKIDAQRELDRSDAIQLRPPGTWSPNRSCRLVKTADGWIAVNLPRDSDFELLPAWLGCSTDGTSWTDVIDMAAERPWRDLVDAARMLGLAVAGVGETRGDSPEPARHHFAAGGKTPDQARVIDLSSLWAGPLCGRILADAGARVFKVESVTRPDPTRLQAPSFFARLNRRKTDIPLDFSNAAHRRELRQLMAGADVVITSARPRAFEQLGIGMQELFVLNPSLTWVAISAHGWIGGQADRVGFGDDAAAAGGLVRFTADGTPRFAGDALADPLTGMGAAVAAMRAILSGGGVLVDAALARVAAGVARA